MKFKINYTKPALEKKLPVSPVQNDALPSMAKGGWSNNGDGSATKRF